MLEVAELTVTLHGRALLRNVSLRVAAGEAVALVGASGSGKSTLLGACLGLLPPGAEASGRIGWASDGCARDLLRLRPAQWRRLRGRGIAWIPQEPAAALDPRYTAAAHLRECLGRRGWARAPQLWQQVGLAGARLHSYPHEWSGGMQQRLLVAMALAHRPRLLLADEPTSALDPLHQQQLLLLLSRLRAEAGFGLLLVTHDLAVASQAAERVYVLESGAVVEQGTVAAVFAHPCSQPAEALVSNQPRWSLQ